MAHKYTFEELKNKISLIDYFVTVMPNYEYSKKKKGFVLKGDKDKTLDLYLFYKNNGNECYINPIDGHSGDLISFMKNVVSSNATSLYKDINDKLHSFINEPLKQKIVEDKKINPETYSFKDKEIIKQFDFELLEKDLKNINLSEALNDENVNKTFNAYLNKREISKSIFNTSPLKDTLLHYTEKNPKGKFTYIGVPIKNIISGEVVGLIKKNYAYSGVVENSKRHDGFVISNYNSKKPIVGLKLFESTEDMYSYIQMNINNLKSENIVYLSSNGAYSESQLSQIKTFVSKHNIKNVSLSNDNDIPGQLYNLKILNSLANNIKINTQRILKKTSSDNRVQMYHHTIDITNTRAINKPYLTELVNKAKEYNSKIIEDYKSYIDNSTQKELESSMFFISKESNTRLHIYVPNNLNCIKMCNQKLISLDNNNIEIKQKTSFTKDFNDDLKAMKKRNLGNNKEKSQTI